MVFSEIAIADDRLDEVIEAITNRDLRKSVSRQTIEQPSRLYMKRTEKQRLSWAEKRRRWVEANETDTRVDLDRDPMSRHGTKEQSQLIENAWRSLGDQPNSITSIT